MFQQALNHINFIVVTWDETRQFILEVMAF